MFSPSSFSQLQVAAKTRCKSKIFQKQTNSRRGNIHTHTQKPEKQWKLKNNHFRRQKKKLEHFKQVMAPSTKPPSFPEGNFTVYDKWSQKTL